MIKKAIALLLGTILSIGFCRATDKTAFFRDIVDEYRRDHFSRAADRCEAHYKTQLKSSKSNLDDLYKDETAKTALLLHFVFKHVLKTGKLPNRDPEFLRWFLQKPAILEELTRFASVTSDLRSALNEI